MEVRGESRVGKRFSRKIFLASLNNRGNQMFNSKGRHVNSPLLRKTTSLGLIGLLISAGLVATATVSQASEEVTQIYCGQESMEYGSDSDLALIEAVSEGTSVSVVRLPLNDFAHQWRMSWGPGHSLTLDDGTEVQVRFAPYLFPNEAPHESLTIEIIWPGVKTADEVWPITLTAYFEPTETIVNPEAEFEILPCSGEVYGAYALLPSSREVFDSYTSRNAVDGQIEIGENDVDFRGLGEIVIPDPDPFAEGDGVVNAYGVDPVIKTEGGGVTLFYYRASRFSPAENHDVDIDVYVRFQGNTVSWTVEVRDPNENGDPARLDFFFDGQLNSDENTQFSSSNNRTYSTSRFVDDTPSTSRFVDETPVLIYNTNTETTTTRFDGEDNDVVTFEVLGATSGFLEVTLIGFDRCATESEIMLIVDEFTANYQANIYTNMPAVAGAACNRFCQPSSETIERSPGNFDLAGVPLCFDTGYESTDPDYETDVETNQAPLWKQEVSDDTGRDFGDSDEIVDNMEERDFVDYQNVAQGSDVTLNAVVTISRLYGQDNDEINSLDRALYRNNAWISTRQDYNSGTEDRYVELSLSFYVSGDAARTPVSVSNLGLSIYDIDEYQFFSASGVKTYSLSADTILTARPNRAELRITEDSGTSSSSDNEESRAAVTFNPANSFVLRFGVTAGDPGSERATVNLDFTGATAWQQTPDETAFRPARGPSGVSAVVAPTPTTSIVAKRTISRFAPESPRLLKAQRASIRAFLRKNPEISRITCTGYTAGPVKRTDRALAKKRATNVCSYIERVKPGIVTRVAARTPGLPLSPLSRKVVIRGTSVNP